MPLPNQIRKLNRALAREQVRARLESWIVEGALRPKEVLNDKQIATAFGVSRMPVREALRTLEDQGLIETALNRWTRVAPLHVDQAENLYSIIAALEALALRTAWPRLGEEDFAVLRAAKNELAEAVANQDAVGATRSDLKFHSVWLGKANNPQLERYVSECRLKLMRIELAYFRLEPDMRMSLVEHGRILKVLERRDLRRALYELNQHWRASVARCLAHLSSGVVSDGGEYT